MNSDFVPLQERYESEVDEILALIADPLISTFIFRERLVALLCSNLSLYHEMFGAEFIGWLKWMQSVSQDRFKRLMEKTANLAENHHIQFLQRFCNFGISADLGQYLRDQVNQSNLMSNFVSSPFLPNRVEIFIEQASKFAGKW